MGLVVTIGGMVEMTCSGIVAMVTVALTSEEDPLSPQQKQRVAIPKEPEKNFESESHWERVLGARLILEHGHLLNYSVFPFPDF
eukprot:6466799-Amphidinium_carterae.1